MPKNPKIYHLTHVDNLTSILGCGLIWSDAERLRQGLPYMNVGMTAIKKRRLEEIEVSCHSGTKVGEYVPFYFCPRSIMLYILHKGNHPDLSYQGGQQPIVHLQADLMETIRSLERNKKLWAFSDRNAGSYLTSFFNSADDLNKINWVAVAATDFRDMLVKESKQAELLVHNAFPWDLIEQIGVIDAETHKAVVKILETSKHRPLTKVERSWYF